MTTTLLDLRRALLQAIPELGATYTLTALATGSITVGSLANTNFPPNKFRNRIAYRGEATTAADYERYLGTLTVASGLIAHTGANYSDTTTTNEEVEIWEDPELRPSTHINPLLSDAISQLRTLCRVPLAHGPIDYDMQASGVTNWTPNSGTPFAKQATAAEIRMGARSGVLTDAGSGGDYTQSALYPLSQGRSATVYAIVKADTGTSKLLVLDGSGNTQDSISTTQEDWVLMMKRVAFDAADEQLRVRLQAIAASDSGDWQAAWWVKEDDYHFPVSRIPGWITEKHHLVGLSVGTPRVVGTEVDTWLYGSMEFSQLTEGIDYYFQRPAADANPTAIFILNTGLMGKPLFMDVSCPASEPYGVAAAFSAETDTTFLSPNLVIAQAKILMGERFSKYAHLKAEGAREKLALIGQEMYRTKEPAPTGWAKRPFG